MLAAIAGGTLACSEPVPIDIDALDLNYPTDGPTPEDRALLEEAEGILGLPFELTRRRRGTIHILLTELPETPDQNQGGTFLRARCYKALVSTRDASRLAHEIGHALGLGHICDGDACEPQHDGNLMHGLEVTGTDLTDEQIDQLERGRRQLTHCR